MLGWIIAGNGKKYKIGQLQKVSIKSIESTKETCPNIWDLVLVDKDKQLWLAMPDALEPNYSFLKTLEKGESFLVELGKVKQYNGKIQEVDLTKKYRQIVIEG